MLTVTDPSDLSLIANPAIRQLVAIRLEQLSSDVPDADSVELFVVEGGDAVSAIQQAAGIAILTSLDDLPFEHPDFTPPFEIMEEHRYGQYRFYELYYVASDSGSGAAIFIPDAEEVDADLLAMCRTWATPAEPVPAQAVSTP